MDTSRKKIRAMIVDDEPIARRNIRALLSLDAEVEIINECGSGAKAVKLIQSTPPDLLFLDIQMPEMSGFDVLKKIDINQIPAIIFITAFDQYALRAFEVHALDYLLKPFDDERFEQALSRAKAQIEQREAASLRKKLLALMDIEEREKPDYAEKFLIRSASRVFFVRADEIDWIEAADYYVRLHVGDHAHMLRETMAELEARLDPEKFLRIHRSAIVNLTRIREAQMKGGECILILNDNTQLKLSRSRREQIEKILNRISLSRS
ncbi:MAG TPA: LytTR family DNA-binding domain-containing protein [Blastocatellia bacterium]|jgi:two-component system LytT family response regulator